MRRLLTVGLGLVALGWAVPAMPQILPGERFRGMQFYPRREMRSGRSGECVVNWRYPPLNGTLLQVSSSDPRVVSVPASVTSGPDPYRTNFPFVTHRQGNKARTRKVRITLRWAEMGASITRTLVVTQPRARQ